MPRRSPIQRLTFLLDAAGAVRKTWNGVSVDSHGEDGREALRALGETD